MLWQIICMICDRIYAHFQSPESPWTLPARIISARDMPTSAVLMAPAILVAEMTPQTPYKLHAVHGITEWMHDLRMVSQCICVCLRT
jgi:hypothetical protein